MTEPRNFESVTAYQTLTCHVGSSRASPRATWAFTLTATIVTSKEQFERLNRLATPLFDRVERDGVASLGTAERVLLIVWYATGQIENGGFDQFFFNSSGDYAWEAPEAFRAIGAAELAAIIERALAVFPNGRPPTDRAERVALLDAIEERDGFGIFEPLDTAFYASPETVNALLVAYVEAHAAEIAGGRATRQDG